MRRLLITILLLSLFGIAHSLRSYARSEASRVNIVSQVSDLRNEANADQTEDAMGHISRRLGKVSSSFLPLACSSVVAACLAVVGLILEAKRQTKESPNQKVDPIN